MSTQNQVVGVSCSWKLKIPLLLSIPPIVVTSLIHLLSRNSKCKWDFGTTKERGVLSEFLNTVLETSF